MAATNKSKECALIITTYNRVDALELVLKSVLKQSIMPDQVVIADDGSGDDTRHLIDRYKKEFSVPLIHCWHEDDGFRAAQIRNRAIAASQGEYIIIIDGDIVLHKHFIKDHIAKARKGCFIQGSRVLILEEATATALRKMELEVSFFSKGISNRKNAIHSSILSGLLTTCSDNKIKGSKSCNMSFWREDILKVNGFNEDFVGWGREDSELVVRLYKLGLTRIKLSFLALCYHLEHPVNIRDESLSKNNVLLQNTILEDRIACKKGIDQYL